MTYKIGQTVKLVGWPFSHGAFQSDALSGVGYEGMEGAVVAVDGNNAFVVKYGDYPSQWVSSENMRPLEEELKFAVGDKVIFEKVTGVSLHGVRHVLGDIFRVDAVDVFDDTLRLSQNGSYVGWAKFSEVILAPTKLEAPEVPTEEKPKVAIGAVVRTLTGWEGVPEGSIGVLTSHDDDADDLGAHTLWAIKTPAAETSPFFYPSELEVLRSADREHKFAVGDRVKVITSDHGLEQQGATGVISRDDRPNQFVYLVTFDDGHTQYSPYNCYREGDLEILEYAEGIPSGPAVTAVPEVAPAAPVVPEKPEFSVGDKVVFGVRRKILTFFEDDDAVFTVSRTGYRAGTLILIDPTTDKTQVVDERDIKHTQSLPAVIPSYTGVDLEETIETLLEQLLERLLGKTDVSVTVDI